MITFPGVLAFLLQAMATAPSPDAAGVDGVMITKASDGRAAECKPSTSRLSSERAAAVCQVLMQRYSEEVATQATADPVRRIWNYSDYPKAALRKRQQGASFIRWEIGVDGAVRSCAVERSSGSKDLDSVSCQRIKELGAYRPALNKAGKPIPTFMTRRVDWSLP
jgi:TonB family protein